MKSSTPFVYADDVTLLCPNTTASQATTRQLLMQSDVDACQSWARNCGGEFSAAKTSVLSTRTGPAYFLDGAPLQVVSTIKHLGVLFDSRLSFQNHFESVLSKFRQRVNLLCYYVKSSNNKSTHVMILYKGYVRPVVEYAAAVWSCRLTAKHTETLEKIQARFVRSYLKKKIKFQYETTS